MLKNNNNNPENLHYKTLTCDYVPEFLSPAYFLVSRFEMLVAILLFRFCLHKIIMAFKRILALIIIC